MMTLGMVMGALGIGGVLFVYGRDLPSYETLSQYTPKTISRIYSGEGQIVDEFALERRLFTPAEEIPDIVKQATGYTIGGVPPFGYVTDMVIYLDEDLNDYDEVWAAAGTPKTVFPIAPSDLLTATRGQFINIKQE